MANIRSSDKTTSSNVPKKLKLSSRELALIEEEKKQKAIRDQEKIRLKQEKLARVVPDQTLQPKKSILKNSGSVQPILVQSNVKASKSETEPQAVKNEVPKDFYDTAKDNRPSESHKAQSDTEAREIPEGFFDDPKLDAKARKVQYVDQEEEEWKRFQSEIASEVITAQEILVEDRNEATAGRQLEEIEEQMEAWKRVAQLEERKEAAHQSIKSKPSTSHESDSESSDVELDQLTDWRKKS